MHAFAASQAPFGVRPLTPRLGAEISGLDLARGIAPDDFRALYDAFLRYQVLLFPPNELPPAAQVAFARQFGEVQVHVMTMYHADGFPELYRLSNLDANGKPDGKHPDKGTLVLAHRRLVAARHRPGDDHLRRDRPRDRRRDALLRHVRRLRAAQRRVEEAHRRPARRPQPRLLAHAPARHRPDDRAAQKKEAPPVEHPIVRRHPETGRTCLYLGDHAESIVGMPYDEGRALIDELNALAVHPDLTYEHHWQPRQLIVWDNRCTMHRATAYDPHTQSRVVRRCTVLGEEPVAADAA